ncbi:MAG: GTPase Era [Gemmatimonadota bacterium]|nr:MAG: GTPase Era [Gemmatimonadota bacterium]
MPTSGPTRCGIIALVGKPNAGKSTLLNALVGTKLAIVSPKPQSTRQPVVGLYSDGDTQLILMDTPGLLEPRYLLQEAMLEHALDVLRRADAVLHLHPGSEGPAPALATIVPPETLGSRPVATVLTGGAAPHHAEAGEPPHATFAFTLETRRGIAEILAWCREQVPEGPFRYDPEDISTQPLRFFVAEFLREAAFELLGEELPYALAAEVDEFREGSEPLYIRATLFVERESQKGMVIGSGGRTIRALGALARQKVEDLLGQQVYLDLWVKVLPKWRRTEQRLRQLGIPPPNARSS